MCGRPTHHLILSISSKSVIGVASVGYKHILDALSQSTILEAFTTRS